MKAIIHSRYGPPEELSLGEIGKPAPGDNDVLIRIHATTVTTSDCNVRNFTFVPRLFRLPARLAFGYKTPRIRILGIDAAGEVEAVGKNVRRFRAGDKVIGSPEGAFGAHAEYIRMAEAAALATKPAGTTWGEAAALPLAGTTALYYIRDLGRIRSGQKVLIIGASGAIGTFSVQLAKYYGAEVTCVCSGANAELVRSLGADKIIDYTKEDFTRNGESYDVIFDVVGKASYPGCRHSLKKGGVLLVNLIELPELIQIIRGTVTGRQTVKGGMAVATSASLSFLKELVESGTLKPVIDRMYRLEEAAQAFRYVEQGHKKGTVVLSVTDEGRRQRDPASR